MLRCQKIPSIDGLKRIFVGPSTCIYFEMRWASFRRTQRHITLLKLWLVGNVNESLRIYCAAPALPCSPVWAVESLHPCRCAPSSIRRFHCLFNRRLRGLITLDGPILRPNMHLTKEPNLPTVRVDFPTLFGVTWILYRRRGKNRSVKRRKSAITSRCGRREDSNTRHLL